MSEDKDGRREYDLKQKDNQWQVLILHAIQQKLQWLFNVGNVTEHSGHATTDALHGTWNPGRSRAD